MAWMEELYTHGPTENCTKGRKVLTCRRESPTMGKGLLGQRGQSLKAG